MVKLLNKICLILFLIFSLLFSQEIVINKIEIQGLLTATEKQIFRNTGLFPSEEFTDENNNNLYDIGEKYSDLNQNNKYDYGTRILKGDEFSIAIDDLWKLKVFSDVQIFVINSYEEGFVDILIELKELPIINSIKIEGNKKFKDNRLIELINFKKSQRVSPNDIYTAKNLILNLYSENNFHNVEIEINLEQNGTDYSKDVVLLIDENNKTKIKQINFEGNNQFEKKYLLKNFQNISENRWYKFWKGDYNENELETDLFALIGFYKNNGYRDMQIVSKNIEFLSDGIYITIFIDEGNINYFDQFNFSGNFKFTDEELLQTINLDLNEQYNEDKFNLAVYSLNSKYMDEGYYYIRIETEMNPVAEDKLVVNFNIDESEKTKIRKVIISGNDKTYDNVIRRDIKIFPGDVFSMNKLEESYRDVFMLDYFDNVNPQIINVGESQQFIDLEFSVIEKETGRANFSMGYNEVHGLTGGGGFDFTNFRGKGQMFSVSYNRGLQNQNQFGSSSSSSYSNNNNSDFESFSFSFREPRIYDTRNSIGVSFSHSEQGRGSSNLLKYDIISDRGSILFGRRFDWPDQFFRGSWTFTVRNTKYLGDINTLLEDFNESIVNQDGLTSGSASRTGIALTQIISRDSRNHPQFPTKGSKFLWSSTFSGNIFGGNENYHKQVFNFDWYSEFKSNIALYQNFKVGALVELDDNQFIPYSARFVMGGSGLPYGEMLRGYPDNGIGPKINSGYYYNYDGGKVLMKYSTELRYKLSDAPIMYLMAYAEAGNIWSDFNTVDMFKLKRSVGVGFRINMPMLGTLGYDVGYGFDSIYDDPEHPRYSEPYGWEQHILFGMPMN